MTSGRNLRAVEFLMTSPGLDPLQDRKILKFVLMMVPKSCRPGECQPQDCRVRQMSQSTTSIIYPTGHGARTAWPLEGPTPLIASDAEAQKDPYLSFALTIAS